MRELKKREMALIMGIAGLYNAIWSLLFFILEQEQIAAWGMLMIPAAGWQLFLGLAVGGLAVLYLAAAWQAEMPLSVVLIGIVTKAAGVMIAATGVQTGNLPETALWSMTVNDLIWIPLFIWIFISQYRRLQIADVEASH